MSHSYPIIHLPDASKFEIRTDEDCALLEYRIADKAMTIHHTYVPARLRGLGIAARLADTAIGFANSNDLKVIPECSYIAAYMKRTGPGKVREHGQKD